MSLTDRIVAFLERESTTQIFVLIIITPMVWFIDQISVVTSDKYRLGSE
jgi:hypothetical protein